ncbi:transglycosylase domain-containing protein [Phytomonospora sp. NPDC050363]|uniref:transglycosylase domain-containing protein n=1 Tax=Phytomonospora sp. NPDC050363 TaxID=3155642 RepID=UPI0033C44C0B
MADHSSRGSARVPGGYDNYDNGDRRYGEVPVSGGPAGGQPYGDRRYGDGPVSGGPAGGQPPAWGDGYDYSDPARNHAEPASGRASVPGMVSAPPAHDPYDYEPPTVGRASVGKAEAKGRATVTGPRTKPSDEELAARKKRLKKKKRIRRWAIFGCVVAVLGGVSVFGVATFWAGVPLPDELELTASSSVTYAGGESMGGIGKEFRVNVPYEQIPEHVKFAVIAAEDETFYTNPGVDFKGVMRAFWNNITGGQKQGASTITQQYAGIAANMRDEATYGRKAREAVIAMKLDDEYSKDEILGFYLDVVYIGRSAYGIGAASLAFYGKPVTELNHAEAALLAAQIKSPDGFYDPEHPEGTGTEADVIGRYHYVLDSMLAMDKIPADEHTKVYNELPKVEKKTSNPADFGYNKSTGFVSHRYVIDELEKRYGITSDMLYGNGNTAEGIPNTIENAGGYTITTTIDKKMQDAAIKAASRGKKGEIMPDQPKNLLAALVAVDPRTGAVKAYYGGTENGTGIDKAGRPPKIKDSDPEGDAHPMGSSFKIFTLASALQSGASVDSKWDGSTPREFEGRMNTDPAGPVVNSGDSSGACARCTLAEEIRQSLNTPMFAIADKWGAERIVEMAAAMGITGLEDNQGKWHEFDKDFDFSKSREWFDREVSFGQYPATVFDMAVGAGTIANNGTHMESHFIAEVTKDGEKVEPKYEPAATPAMGSAESADISWVLSSGIQPSVGPLEGGMRPNGSKTGTWERDCVNGEVENCNDGENSNTSYVGYTPQLSTAVWVGDKKNDNGKVTDVNGNELYGSMTAGSVWKNFMEKALAGEEVIPFPAKVGTGDINAGDAKPDKEKDKDKCTPIIDPNCPIIPGGPGGPGTDGEDGQDADGNNGNGNNDNWGIAGGAGSAPFASDGAIHSGESAHFGDSMSVLPYATFERGYSLSST